MNRLHTLICGYTQVQLSSEKLETQRQVNEKNIN